MDFYLTLWGLLFLKINIMAATRKDVDRWIDTAKEKGCKFIISVCDKFDYDDYPVYIKDLNELIMRVDEYDGVNMQSINEIIRINDDGSVTENLTIYNATK